MENTLAPGFRFYPTEEELISFYLHNKLEGKREDIVMAMDRVIPVLDVYNFDPWDLPQLSGALCRGDKEQWFFFSPRQESEIQGGRPSRHNTTGYWKSSGSLGHVYSSNNRCIGAKRTLIFYKGRVPDGRKTEWKINEYKAIQIRGDASSSSNSPNPTIIRQEFSLCRVYKTSKVRRSFDRRPIAFEIGESSLRATELAGEEAKFMGDGTTAVADLTTREDNGFFPSSQTEDTNMAMPLDTGPLWDWEELYNWDYDIHI